MNKTTVSTVLIVLILVSFINIIPINASVVFSDVKETDWFYKDVIDVYNLGLLSGGNGIFGVTDNITYAHFIKGMVAVKWPGEIRALQPGESWPVPFMEVAIKHGLIQEGEIENYNAPCPREKMMVLICKTLGVQPEYGTTVIFSDTVNKPEAGYINAAYNEYLTEGGSGGKFAYGTMATRAQLATMVMKAYKYNLDPSAFKISKATERKAALDKLMSSGKNPYTLQTIRFYNSPYGATDIEKRVYKAEFPSSVTEYVNWEVVITNPIFENDRDIIVKQIYYDSQGRVINSDITKPGEYKIYRKTSSTTISWGAGGGIWSEGTYKVEIYIDNFKTGTSYFTITAGNNGKKALTTKEIAQKINAVVLLNVYDKKNEIMSTGSGFFVSENGKLVTNYHVIDKASWVEAVTSTGEKYRIDSVCDYSVTRDIAILQINSAKSFPYLVRGDSDLVELGEDIVAIGSPLGLSNTVSTGIVSSIRSKMVRTIEDAIDIQISAPISHGSSGGALFNVYGEVIGITYAGLESMGGENLNFAIPINEITAFLSVDHKYTFGSIYRMEHFIRFDDGAIYEGDILNGKPHGEGTMVFPNGDGYTGGFIDGYRSGYGIYTWAEDGQSYSGDWLLGKRHGKGMIIDPADGSMMVGTWVDNVMQGPGLFYDKYGVKHTIEVLNDKVIKFDGNDVSN